jgi:hypothetical protein
MVQPASWSPLKVTVLFASIDLFFLGQCYRNWLLTDHPYPAMPTTMFTYRVLVVLLLPLFAFQCVSKKMLAYFIEVENQIDKNIYCISSFNYPDTTLSFTSKEFIFANDDAYYISSLSKRKPFYNAFCKRTIWTKLLKSDSLQIFVFDDKVLKGKSWNEITANRIYLRRLVYSYNDIVNNSCKIVVK